MSAPDFTLIAGNNHLLQITITSGGLPLDLTLAAYIVFRVGANVAAVEPWSIEKTIGAGVTVMGAPTEGVIQIEIEPADTIDLAGSRYYEIEVKEASGDISTVKTGKLKIAKSLVRAADIA